MSNRAMVKFARAVLLLAALAGGGLSSCVVAVNFIAPTPEEKVRCDAFAEEHARAFCLHGYSVAGLRFPDAARELGIFTTIYTTAIYKPEGNGPFPALVLLHTCGPIEPQHFYYWVRQALNRGYVAFVVDSWQPRGIINGICRTRYPGFYAIPVRARDAYDALQHLSKFDFVDSRRVGVIGFSHGGRVTYNVASKTVAQMFSPQGKRFAAAVSVYGQCFNPLNKQSNIWPDIDVPLLSLLGEQDEDGDPNECVPRLHAAKDKGAPVDWHVFPNAVHAWDQPRNVMPHRIYYYDGPGGSTMVAYDSRVAAESRDMAFAFVARHLKPQQR